MRRGPSGKIFFIEILIISGREKSQKDGQNQEHKKEKLYMGNGQGGFLKSAGRTVIVFLGRVFRVKEVNKQHGAQKNQKKSQMQTFHAPVNHILIMLLFPGQQVKRAGAAPGAGPCAP
ncbi:MAG: hypothetical protein JW747_04685 [Candidatus Aminicenantes bacterium]|nr:hypothetical protein [Candidatus Aminicenantes bacterium]